MCGGLDDRLPPRPGVWGPALGAREAYPSALEAAMSTPFLVLGDGPGEPTGLGRIARDLTALLLESGLDLEVVQVGGPLLPVWTEWRHIPMPEEARYDEWGVHYVEAVWESLWGRRPGILFCVWDPSRLYPYISAKVPAQRWAYTALD